MRNTPPGFPNSLKAIALLARSEIAAGCRASFPSSRPRFSFPLPPPCFSTYANLNQSRTLDGLSPRIPAQFLQRTGNELLSLEWPSPPRNVLLIKKTCAPEPSGALREFASHVKSAYSDINILVEPSVAAEFDHDLGHGIFTSSSSEHGSSEYHDKVDLVVTFGGDGTILHAASLFSAASSVPPILSFSMGTLGFLGEWKFSEYKHAFREVYMSGAPSERHAALQSSTNSRGPPSNGRTGWSSVRGKALGSTRGAKILIRQRLQVGVYDAQGERLSSNGDVLSDIHAMNEVILHRGQDPHLAIVEVFVGGRFLTEAVADGMIISTPTGSTAYSLSSGGSIIHPLVPSILLTPICARSLSFRPLVLPATTPITLRLSEKNRGREVDLSIDGMRRSHGIGVGAEVRVSGEEIKTEDGKFEGGIPCVLRQTRGGVEGDDSWVGGLNGLLKFNYPFGEET